VTTFRIGEVAEQVGVTPRTIRYYEELGLLGTGEDRSKGAHRHYTDADVARLRELIRLRDLLGLSLDELIAVAEAEEARAALRDQWHGDPTDEERIAIIDRALELAQQQLDLVTARRQTLDEFAGELRAKLRRLNSRRRELGQVETPPAKRL
jgi:DNA-binding transcriptional MerR regulator